MNHARSHIEAETALRPTSARPAVPGQAPFLLSDNSSSVLQLQRTIGNQAAQGLLMANGESPAPLAARFAHQANQIQRLSTAKGPIQTKPIINTVGDAFEREADRVAHHVTTMPETQPERDGDHCV